MTSLRSPSQAGVAPRCHQSLPPPAIVASELDNCLAAEDTAVIKGTIVDSSPILWQVNDTAIRIGSWLGKYLVTGWLGAGTQSVVLRGWNPSLHRTVAIKLFRLGPQLQQSAKLHVFRLESRLLAQLHHSHVLGVWDFDDNPSLSYLVLEYVDGFSLLDLLHVSGRLAVPRIVEYLRQSLQGLAAVWEMGIIHRDIKPSNLLITREGQVKLADCGLLRLFDDPDHDKTLATLSSPAAAYIAPERLEHPAKWDHRSDLYALGATFYHALTNRPPFIADGLQEMRHKHGEQQPVPPHWLNDEVDPMLSSILMKMLAKRPVHRYQSVAEIQADLERIPTASGAMAELPRERGLQHEGRDQSLPAAAAAEVQLAHAIKLGLRGQNLRAMQLLRQIVEQQPEYTDAWLWMARLCDAPQEAIGYLRPLLLWDPQHEAGLRALKAAWLQIARTELQRGRPDSARHALSELLSVDSEHEAGWLLLAQLAPSSVEGLACYQRVLQVNPRNPTARMGVERIRRSETLAQA